jgi:inhibitor of KinA
LGVRYLPAGDAALTVELGNRIALSVNQRVRAFCQAVEKAGIPGVIEVVPTYRSFTVYFDPLLLDLDSLIKRLRALEAARGRVSRDASRILEVPVIYGGVYGPDLPSVAKLTGLREEEIIKLHSQPIYHVFMLGFTAGFPYLGLVHRRLRVPRLETPRLKVPAGSVGVAGSQTGIYPRESPGGWRIIGWTALTLFDPTGDPPALLRPGDRVRFTPVTGRNIER